MSSGSTLHIRMGHMPGASLRVKALNLTIQGRRDNIIDAVISQFSEVAVATSGKAFGKKTNRCVVIVPSDTENSIEWKEFYVRGQFQITDKVWDPALASQMFKEFQPS